MCNFCVERSYAAEGTQVIGALNMQISNHWETGKEQTGDDT